MIELSRIMMNKEANLTSPPISSRKERKIEKFTDVFNNQLSGQSNKLRREEKPRQSRNHHDKRDIHTSSQKQRDVGSGDKVEMKDDITLEKNQEGTSEEVKELREAKKLKEAKELKNFIIEAPQDLTKEEVLKILQQLKMLLEAEEESINPEMLEAMILQVQQWSSIEEVLDLSNIKKLLLEVEESSTTESAEKLKGLLSEIETNLEELHSKMSKQPQGVIETEAKGVPSKEKEVDLVHRTKEEVPEEKIVEGPKIPEEKGMKDSFDRTPIKAEESAKDPQGIEDASKLIKEAKLNTVSIEHTSLYTKDINTNNILEQVVHKVDALYKSGKNQLSIRLTPENLGKLSIELTAENNDIKGKVYVESLQVKEVIENNLNQLRESLKEKGIFIANLEVSVGGDSENFQREKHLAGNPFRLKSKGRKMGLNSGVSGIEAIEEKVSVNPYVVNSSFDKLI